MKLSCTRENLHQGLAIVSHLTSKNVNLPILQNILLKAEGGAIKFSSTNLDMAINCAVRGKVDETGECTAPSKLFFDYVSLLPNETVTLETDGAKLNVRCGAHKTKINGLPASEFPLVPSVKTNRSYTIPVEEFKTALSRVLFSVATNESRPELTGVFMKFLPGSGEARLVLAATDSYRLSECVIPLVSPVSREDLVIVPARTLSEINRILSVFRDEVESPSTVAMNLSDSQIVFSYGPVELISRCIEGNYPDYTQIIPKQFQTEARVDREDFAQAVKAASLFSRTGLFDITVSFDPGAKQLSVSAADANRGENTATCAADCAGNSNSVTLNFRYLLDGLNAIGANTILFQMIDAGNPCVVTPQNGDGYRYIIMPIRQ
jgi:DNA polymerase-3 subunit beta